MPKTNFGIGTVVEPGWLNSVYAHAHDGENSDGHVAKINLTNASEVSGSLPVANQVDHVHDGTERAKVNPDTHLLGITPNQFLATVEGVTGVTQITVSYRKYANVPITGFPVTVELYLPEVTGLATGSYVQLSIGSLPEDIRPSASRCCPLFVWNNSSQTIGMAKIMSNGGISFAPADTTDSPFLRFSSTGFSGTNNRGFTASCIKYIL
jgi:hypothetical protein